MRIRKHGKTLESAVVLVGLGLVLIPAAATGGSAVQVGALLLGLVFLLAGVRNLSQRVLPEERRFLALRRGVDAFRDDVRRLNRLVVEGRSEEAAELKGRLHRRVDTLVEAAGRDDEPGDLPELEREGTGSGQG